MAHALLKEGMPRLSSFAETYTSSTESDTLVWQQSLIALEKALDSGDIEAAQEACTALQEYSLSPRLYESLDLRDPGKVMSVGSVTRSSR
jgi:hypothetical protein